MVLLLTKNPNFPGVCEFQPHFMGPLHILSLGLSTYCLDFSSSMDAVYPWFHNRLLKPARSQPTWPPALDNNFYEVEAIIQISKHGINA